MLGQGVPRVGYGWESGWDGLWQCSWENTYVGEVVWRWCFVENRCLSSWRQTFLLGIGGSKWDRGSCNCTNGSTTSIIRMSRSAGAIRSAGNSSMVIKNVADEPLFCSFCLSSCEKGKPIWWCSCTNMIMLSLRGELEFGFTVLKGAMTCSYKQHQIADKLWLLYW